MAKVASTNAVAEKVGQQNFTEVDFKLCVRDYERHENQSNITCLPHKQIKISCSCLRNRYESRLEPSLTDFFGPSSEGKTMPIYHSSGV